MILVVGSVATVSYAQVIEGRVLDAETRLSLPGATLVLMRGDLQLMGQIADGNGEYRFSGLNLGTYIVEASFIGYESRRDTLTLPLADRHDFLLKPTRTLLDELVVETLRIDGERFAAGLETVRPEDLSRVPMADLSYDLAGYLVTLPGVVSMGDRGGQLFVRGGTPTQNLVLLDGMRIFQPFHIVGFYSAFPADIISYVDFYAGGFNARYGGRISSVIDIRTKNGNKNRVTGSVTLAPFLSGIQLEIPVVVGKASLVLSARESLIDRIPAGILGEELPFRFGDRFAKFHAFLSPTSSVTLTALRTSDTGNLKGDETGGPDAQIRKSTWKNQAYGGKLTYIPAEAAVMTEFAVYYSSLESRYRLTKDEIRSADVSELSFNMGFTYLLGPNQINFGIFGTTNFFNYSLGSTQTAISSGVSSGGAFIEGQIQFGEQLRLEPGVRLETFARGLKRSFGPRMRLIYLPAGKGSHNRFSLAWGRYHQQIIGLSNEQDVSDVFTIWSASPRGTAVPRATHYIAGWKGRPTPWLELSFEGYIKNLSSLSFPVFSNEVSDLAEFSQVNGRAEGYDAKVEIIHTSVFLSVSYGRSKVEYTRPEQLSRAVFRAGTGRPELLPELEFNPPHDRRHQVNAMAQYRFGKNKLGVRWQYGSGLPFTQVNGYYTGLDPLESSGDAFRTAGGTTLVSRAEPYGARLPAYHRLDVTYERRVSTSLAELTFQAGVVNAYDRANIFEYNIFTGSRVDQLPLIPSIGVRIDVR